MNEKAHTFRNARFTSRFNEGSRLEFGAKMTSYRRRCDVITSHQGKYDIIFMSCACWTHRLWTAEHFFRQIVKSLSV